MSQVKIEANNGKITKVQFSQQMLALIFALEKTQAKLRPEEVALREQCKASGTTLNTVGTGIIGED